MSFPSERVVIGMDPHKRSATIEIMSADETIHGGGRFATDRDGYAARFELDADERAALVTLDRDALRERFAINPMLLYQLEARVKP